MVEDNNDDNTHIHVVLTKDTMVHHYRIIEKIGAGSMGEVYLAEDTKLKRNVALKFLPSHMCDDNDCRTRFTREAQAVAKLNHPNIITIYEVSDFNGRPFFAMEHIDGKTVYYYSYQEKLSLIKIVKLSLQITEGLTKAHESGITHRDIKSINIMVDKDLQPKILDFGLATIKGGDQLTKVGSTLGTFAYMSPEQAQGKELDHRSDIFSLGVVIYELLTGQSPFKSSNDAGTINNVINHIPNSISKLNSETPQELEDVISKCLQKDPIYRYQETNELVDALRKVKNSMSKKDNQQSSENNTSIAVLPFANMSADPENEYFADGLTEELLNVLAKNPELKVIGRTSSFAFKGKQEDIRGIGTKLGVNTILEGSVRKSGNRVRITAQLVKTSDGFHLWSETYDRVIEDIFAVQDEISEAVAKELHVTLLGKPKEKQVVNPQSYEYYLKAQQERRLWNPETAIRAIELFKKSIELEPNNAKALAGLASIYLRQCVFSFGNHDKTYRLAKKTVMKALEFDNNFAEAYGVLGWIRFSLEFHFDEAEVAFKKAFEIAPNNSRIVDGIASFRGLLGDFEEGMRLTQRSIQLDPLNPRAYFNLGKLQSTIGQYDESLISMQKTLELSNGMPGLYTWMSKINYIIGNYDKALELAKLETSEGRRFQALTIAYYGLGLKKESDEIIRKTLEMRNRDVWAFQLAMIYGERNEVDESFKWLDIAIKDRDAGITQIKIEYYLKNLHNDPRWPMLLQKVGFTD